MIATAAATVSPARRPGWAGLATVSSDASVLAAEHRPAYDGGSGGGRDGGSNGCQDGCADGCADGCPDGGSGGGRGGEAAPFGLPVLAELPELAALLTDLDAAERAAVRATVTLAGLLDTGQVEAVTGVGVEQWVGIVARQTRLDRRLLVRLARLLNRLPALKAAAEQGQLSFAQLRGIGLACRDGLAGCEEQLDGFLAVAVPELVGADPDVLVTQVRGLLDELAPAHGDQREPDATARFLALQPTLDGSGVRLAGFLDPVAGAILDEATAPTAAQRAAADHGSVRRLRADNLIARLARSGAHTAADTADDTAADPTADTDDAGPGPGTDRADRAGDADRTSGAEAPLPPVRLLLRVSLETLLGGDRVPAQLLTRLVGGQLRLSSSAARRLVDERGAELRTIVVDDGRVVGVGRRQRFATGWLGDATLTLHDTCSGPELCDRPARGAQIDHARPWTPARADDPYGTTDIDNIGPLCDTTNAAKERAGWIAAQTPDGRRTWTHPRSGLAVITVPARWRPPGWSPPDRWHHPPTVTHPPDRHPPDRHPPDRHPPDRHHGPSSGARSPHADATGPPRGTGSDPQPHLDDDGRPLPF